MTKIGEIIMKIITNIILAFLILAVILMSYSYYSINIKKKAYVNYFGYTFFEVATGSMANTINIDDLIVVKLGSSYKANDIITYQNGKDFITHRVIKIDEYNGMITAKGDANNTTDALVKPNDVLGKVVKIYPKLGIWKKVILTPKVIIIMFVTLVLFNFAFSYNKKQKIKKEKILETIKEEPPKKKLLIKHHKEKLPFRK
jgi:signal peptidase I